MGNNTNLLMLHESFHGLVKLILGVVLAMSAVFYVSQYARSIDRTYPAKTFTVDGSADIDVRPDLASFTVGLVTEGGTDVGALQAKNTEKMNQVTQYLKDAGVDPKDLKTMNYNLNPRYSNPTCDGGVCPPSTIVGYTVDQSLQVKVRDTGKIGELLTGVVQNGGNTVSQVQFVLDDDTDVKAEARAEAIGKARAKAEAIARAGGFRLGKLVTLYETSDVPQPYAYGMGGGAMEVSAVKQAAPVIEPGTQNTKVNVSMTYEILN